MFNFVRVSFTKPLDEPTPSLLQDVSLICDVMGDPEPNITWYKNEVMLKGERSRELVIREMDLKDRGEYHCNASNFDPNKPVDQINNNFVVKSEVVVMNIKGTVF